MQGKYANIIVDISHEKVDRPFQYRIPERLRPFLQVGMSVNIPFGMGNRLLKGYVIEITDVAEISEDRMKNVDSIGENEISVESDAIRLAWWIKEHYGSTMITSLKTVLPVKTRMKHVEKKTIVRVVSSKEAQEAVALFEKKHQVAKVRLLQELIENESLPHELVSKKLNISSSTIRSLENAGFIQVVTEQVYRNPMNLQQTERKKKALTPEQQEIADTVIKDYQEQNPQAYLLYGVTGSGKTEVYMEMIEKMIQMRRQAIVLIPEIALTYQTLIRFYTRFGDRVSVMNSKLSAGERFDQFERARKGEIDIMIGPRSALFTPFERLGLVIIDEEHEGSYKSETMPKYHARDVAMELCQMKEASLVLGSATPSMEAFFQAQMGQIKLFTLPRRLSGGELPTVHIADLREELRQGNRSIFSRKLQELLADRLAKKEQSMLFINRRGYAGFVSCRACGHVMKCPHCDVSLSEHRDGRLVCHYCGYMQPMVQKCPSCGSKYILGFRAGTQQIEEALQKQFPSARILRMDADTTRQKDSYEDILSRFANREADILVGTQMIVKGHDFPYVTLMGVIAADLSLHTADFRAAERTFQLITQAAGRAGRGTRPGEVVIQTYQPEHYAVVHAANQDYDGFYQEEIAFRRLMSYPPVSNMFSALLLTEDEETGMRQAKEMIKMLSDRFLQEEMVLIGPAAATISRISDIYRTVFYVKHDDYNVLIQIKDSLEQYIDEKGWKREHFQFDFNPMNIM